MKRPHTLHECIDRDDETCKRRGYCRCECGERRIWRGRRGSSWKVKDKQPLRLIRNALDLAKEMDALSGPNGNVRVSESEYGSGIYFLRADRQKVARVSRAALSSSYFYLYSRAYYRSMTGYPGRRRWHHK